jgi:hypothetical protein
VVNCCSSLLSEPASPLISRARYSSAQNAVMSRGTPDTTTPICRTPTWPDPDFLGGEQRCASTTRPTAVSLMAGRHRGIVSAATLRCRLVSGDPINGLSDEGAGFFPVFQRKEPVGVGCSRQLKTATTKIECDRAVEIAAGRRHIPGRSPSAVNAANPDEGPVPVR